MTRVSAGLLAVTLAAVPNVCRAQLRPGVNATTRLLEPTSGTTAPSLWLGFDLRVDRPRWELAVASSGALGSHGAWGGDVSLDARYRRPLGRRTTLFAQANGAFDRPLGVESVGEGSAQLAIGRQLGPAVVRFGVAGLERFQQGRTSFAPGAFASTTLDLGELALSAEVGRFVAVAGSANGSLPGDRGKLTDTLAAVGGGAGSSRSARALSHGTVGARWRRDWWEVSARVMSRTRLALDEGLGWEAGMAVEPFSGTKLRVKAGRSPASASLYLPYRRQLSLGVELSKRRSKPEPARAAELEVQAMFQAVPGEQGMTNLLVRGPDAARVEVAGDFTEWQPVALSFLPGRVWQAAFVLPRGIHQINVRFDNGPWEVPDGLGSADDGFGGRVGVLVVR